MVKYPIPGTAILLFHSDRQRILLAERLGTHNGGVYGTPGGKIEFGVDPVAAAATELYEESAILLDQLDGGIQPLPIIHSEFFPDENAHYICLWFFAYLKPGIDSVPFRELDMAGKPKMGPWTFYWRDNLPSKIWGSIPEALKVHETLPPRSKGSWYMEVSHNDRAGRN